MTEALQIGGTLGVQYLQYENQTEERRLATQQALAAQRSRENNQADMIKLILILGAGLVAIRLLPKRGK